MAASWRRLRSGRECFFSLPLSHNRPPSKNSLPCQSRQESFAIAKMTAQYALYMGALKFSGLPDYANDYYSQHFSCDFVPIDPMNVPTKFEVRSFTCS